MVVDDKLISVIVPCYKQARFLGEAIESVLAQTYPNFEIIVVDDGSPDDASEVAAGYPCVRYIRQQNQGVSAARNAGTRQSKGYYLFFLDADDRLLPDALEVSLNYLKTYPEAALVYGRNRFISLDGSPLPITHRPSVEGNHYLALLGYNYILTGTAMMRRDVFEALGGFNTSLHGCEDYDFNLRVARSFPIYCHQQEIMEYRRHGTSASHDLVVQMKTALSVLRSQQKYVRGNRQREKAYNAGREHFQNFYGDQLAYEVQCCVRARSNWKQAAHYALTLLRYHPKGFVRHAYRKLRNVAYNRKADSTPF